MTEQRRYPSPQFPSRPFPETASLKQISAQTGEVWVNGRVARYGKEEWRLVNHTGQIRLRRVQDAQVCEGDIVGVRGRIQGSDLLVDDLAVLAPCRNRVSAPARDWLRFNRCDREILGNLELRATVMREIRRFFDERGFLEVETPSFVRAPGQEAHLQLFETAYRENAREERGYLITSPEHHMKRLLGGGFGPIYQLCACFRNGERTEFHNPEFTMLEWYRPYASYVDIMADVEDLVRHVVKNVLQSWELVYGGQCIDIAEDWDRYTVAEAFAEFARIDLCENGEELCRRAREAGCGSVGCSDSWEETFFKILIERVEPGLKEQGAVLLMDYPAAQSALAKLKEDDPQIAERVEVYIAGVELANGYTELNDPEEQRERFERESRRREKAGNAPLPIDEAFLEMMEYGMPPAGGMALGVDRLVMLLADARSLDEVIAFPYRG